MTTTEEQEIIGILYQMEKNEDDEEHAILRAFFTDEALMYKKIDELMESDDEYVKEDFLRYPLFVMWVPLNVIDSWTVADSMQGDYGSDEIDMKKLYPQQYIEFNKDLTEGKISYYKDKIQELEEKLTKEAEKE
jgi:hypothetical protein